MASAVCENCGAENNPSLVVCPYCRATIPQTGVQPDSSLAKIASLYAEGKVDKALQLIATLERERPKTENDAAFLVLYCKILFESEGPLGKLRILLGKAFVVAPANPEVMEYLEILDAREKFDLGMKEIGENTLKALLKRSPKNFHALFMLGTHLFWAKRDVDMAMHYLERCVLIRPTLLRAWACLGAIYKATGRKELSACAFRKCIELETNPQMRNYFKSLMAL